MTPIDWFSLLHPVLGILVPREHTDHGRWLTAGVVVAVQIALVYSFLSKAVEPGAAFAGGSARLGLLKVKLPALRVSFTLLTWAGLLGLGSQPEIWRLSDNPFSAAFWSSHYWSGVLLTESALRKCWGVCTSFPWAPSAAVHPQRPAHLRAAAQPEGPAPLPPRLATPGLRPGWVPASGHGAAAGRR